MKAKKRNAAFTAGCVIACCVAAGVASAGNPHGTPPGQASKQQAASSTQSTTAANATGVKPSSTTQHHTFASAGSNQTKLYGNGKTAGQIAMQNGASADTQLYGPGNSQPHKVLACSKNGKSHYFDVHALKHKNGKNCTGGVTAQSSVTVTQQNTVAATLNAQTTAGIAGVAGAVAGTSKTTGHTASPQGGVLGASASLKNTPVTRRARPAHAVLGSAHFTG